jgi:hypothetical protein
VHSICLIMNVSWLTWQTNDVSPLSAGFYVFTQFDPSFTAQWNKNYPYQVKYTFIVLAHCITRGTPKITTWSIWHNIIRSLFS